MSQSEMSARLASLRVSFNTGLTKPLTWRKTQLKGVLTFLDDHFDDIVNALYVDLLRPKHEIVLTEIGRSRIEATNALKYIDHWVKDEPVSPVLLTSVFSKYVHYEPLGLVLVISSWNFPICLSLVPIIGALAAGNCVVLKPSEISTSCEKLLAQHLPKYLDHNGFTVITADGMQTAELLRTERMDFICYTGSTNVGKMVMRAASEYLTPVLMECGGKSPCIIHRRCNVAETVKSICFGKFTNAGQICLAPDYVLVDNHVKSQVIETFKQVLTEWYPDQNLGNTDVYAKIINERHFHRLRDLMNGLDIVYGGKVDVDRHIIGPTIAVDVDPGHPIMQDEIFGPLLPCIGFDDLDVALDFVNSRPKPLALYLYTDDNATVRRVVNGSTSGACCVNECMTQHSVLELPFGGVGDSGFGKLNGIYSFKSFSNAKAVLCISSRLKQIHNWCIYPPSTPSKTKMTSCLNETRIRIPTLRGSVCFICKAGLAVVVLAIGFVIGYHAK